MRQNAVVSDDIAEVFKGRHLDVIGRGPIKSALAAVPDVGTQTGKESLGCLNALDFRARRRGRRFVAIHLSGVEHGAAVFTANFVPSLSH